MRRSILLCFLIISGCASFRPATVTPQMVAGAKTAVLSSLKDPSSAQFGDRFDAAERNGKIAICGTVNARNGFGGYTGIKTFAVRYDPGTGDFTNLGEDGNDVFCELAGAKNYSTTPPASVLSAQGVPLEKAAPLPHR